MSSGQRLAKCAHRSAHTLFEVLLALGLSLLLLSAVYAALDMHWRYSIAGQRQTEQLQIARALFEMLSGDVRNVVFRPPLDQRAPLTENVTRIEVMQESDRYAGRSIGVVGDAERLWLHVNQAAPQTQLTIVRWSINNTSDASGEAGLMRAVSGLRRTDGEEPSDQMLAAEVERIHFRYFDGQIWREEWDSVILRQLPKAVEVVIEFRPTDEERAEDISSTQHRLVIPVPAAEA